jgi:hypothetical protein
MKIYHLKANVNKKWFDMEVVMTELTPIFHRGAYTFEELVKFMDYTHYEPDWKVPMDEEYKELYRLHGDPKVDFFKVKNHNLIVMPGTYLYPTILTMQDIEDLDRYQKIF